MTDTATGAKTRFELPTPLRAILVLALLYLFLAGVRLLEGGIKGFGSDFTDTTMTLKKSCMVAAVNASRNSFDARM